MVIAKLLVIDRGAACVEQWRILSGSFQEVTIWSVETMKLQKILTVHIHITGRGLVMAIATMLLFTALLLWAGGSALSPRFSIDSRIGGVNPFAYPQWRIASDWLAGRKYVVLTFDDGPYGLGVDERILQTLRRHHAHAIFFQICNHFNAATEHVDSEIEAAGNLIGNHTYDHPHLNQLGPVDLQHQIEGCSARIAALSGHRPHYFRPPFGETSLRVMQAAQQAGMEQVLWNANSEDSWLKKPDQIQYWSHEQTENGSILLMHSIPTTEVVLERVLTDLEERGFVFVLPDEMPSAKFHSIKQVL
jgi:peptidoglycan/xylan/chitin deacetylase (PgdA/CDA1 family)